MGVPVGGHRGGFWPPGTGTQDGRLGNDEEAWGCRGRNESHMMGTVAQEGYEEKGARLGVAFARVTSPSLPLRVCSVRSVDGSPTTAFTVLECEGSRRLGSRPRRYLLTGQANGSLAMWDLTTAMDGLGQAPGTPHLPQSYPKPHGLSRNLLHNLLYHDLPTSPCPLTPVSAPNLFALAFHPRHSF